ncbi:MAG: AAA family ATPase [Mariniblastus sp.]
MNPRQRCFYDAKTATNGDGTSLDKKNSDVFDELPESKIAVSELQQSAVKLLDNMASVVLGKREIAKLCLVALLADEHVLLEDVPGVGKTLMGKALARSVDGEFRRVQFTPDLLPSDIVGSSIFNSQRAEFEFNEGPIFSNFVLADEINRAPPRTQSALLEAMSDAQVSVDGTTHTLAKPFMVIATQNPFESEGTYVLPESQLDRFLLRISMGYPERKFEADILKNHRNGQPVDKLTSVCDWRRVLQMQKAVRDVKVEDSISQYILDIVHETRDSSELSVGISTRGALSWYRAVQSLAFLDRRDYAIPDDAKSLAVPVLSHRVQLRGGMQGGQRDDVEAIIKEITSKIGLPT